MKLFSSKSIQQLPASKSDVFAFRISGHVSDDDSQAMSQFMNHAFDECEEVKMLLLFDGYEGGDWDRLLDIEVIKTRFRALSKVTKYAVVGAPDSAETIIKMMNYIIPVEAKTFDIEAMGQAWNFVNAQPAAAAAHAEPMSA